MPTLKVLETLILQQILTDILGGGELRGLSSRANYTGQATAACRQS
jgi:hypothetical protein